MFKKPLKAHEQSLLVVGKKYQVAHVTLWTDYGIYTIPVIPIWHNDKNAFGFDKNHYHIDGRFVENGDPISRRWNVLDGKSEMVVINDGCMSNHKNIFYLKRECLRLNTGLDNATLNYIRKWRKSMEGKSCAGKKCPHYGTTMIEVDGKLVCPLHGLTGDMNTEKII